ncbi:MAG: hypothetical protein HY514_04855 [Candidatus Aenigmarchaeota archaeon]|nr:hypothetical protein [Candidatus Aenigmarchaeota archaeon]
MAAGSWVRFFVGLLLSIEAIRLWITGSGSIISSALAVIYIILAIAFAVFRF